MTSVTVRAPAKVNLALSVGARARDGFHPVATVYQAVGLHDDVRAVGADSGRFAVHVHGEGADQVPTGEKNLAVRAAARLARHHVLADAGADLHVRKSIPVAGGMAGGSADAAATLLACDALWALRTPRATLLELAADLGSDVPFALVGGTAVGAGRGERLTPVLGRGRYDWVVALAAHGLPTAAVYAELDRLRGRRAAPPPAVPDDLMAALRRGDPVALGAALCNDLQPAALSLDPDLAATLEAGDRAGALGSLVSGSGPTAVFLARDPDHAADLAAALLEVGVCRDVRQVRGPVPGARRVA